MIQPNKLESKELQAAINNPMYSQIKADIIKKTSEIRESDKNHYHFLTINTRLNSTGTGMDCNCNVITKSIEAWMRLVAMKRDSAIYAANANVMIMIHDPMKKEVKAEKPKTTRTRKPKAEKPTDK